ncbi:hypothetical protein COJ96_26445 [Bacillus sp. AFS073361]|uniref:hypothetical protein n=1 Tax=Bacillus sp. AFS073361 TaxID=2033511 RepID=UPI000BFA3B3A|nr:hypothetical protein [Bacillus sp. AFS073361]PFP17554.1 hypothetical protein COJ96_26445 [Bacillus sp. AFS073361]
MFELTGDYKYASVYEKVKKYRRPYWDLRDYGAISLSELYKCKLAKIEIIKRLHKQNGVANSTVNMENNHGYYVAKEEIEAYIKNRRNKMKQLNRRIRHFDMLKHEMWGYVFYFNTKNRMEEVRELSTGLFLPVQLPFLPFHV